MNRSENHKLALITLVALLCVFTLLGPQPSVYAYDAASIAYNCHGECYNTLGYDGGCGGYVGGFWYANSTVCQQFSDWDYCVTYCSFEECAWENACAADAECNAAVESFISNVCNW